MYKTVGMCSDADMESSCDATPQIEYAPASICPLVSKTLKKNQIPIYDTCGPFPDESILSGIDRLLFLIGPGRIQKMLNLPTPLVDSISSSSESTIEVTPQLCPATEGYNDLSGNSMAAVSRGSTSPMHPIGPPIIKKCCGCCKQNKASSIGTTTTPFGTPSGSRASGLSRVQIREAIDVASGAQQKAPPLPLKRSFSLCSLACRKRKQNMSFQSPSGTGNAYKWLWTRMQCSDDGYEIYEVFKNSSVVGHPSHIGSQSLPHLIMVVLPNGCIMPFETITCH